MRSSATVVCAMAVGLAAAAADQEVTSTVVPDATISAVVEGGCPGTKTSTYKCREWICLGDTWELVPKAAGTPCNDDNACTYADVCDGGVTCRGTVGCIPSAPCEACNGTPTCGKAPAGTPCPSSPDGNPCEAVCDGTSLHCQPL